MVQNERDFRTVPLILGFCSPMQYKPSDLSLGSLHMQGTLFSVSLQYRHYYFNLIHRSWTPSSFRSNE